MAKQNVKFVTPKVRLAYPKLNTPDTKFKAEGEYVAKGVLLGPVPDAILNKAEALLDEFVAEKRKEFIERKQAAKAKAIVVKRGFIRAETDGETGDDTGNFTIQAKMKAQYKDKKTQVIKTQKPKIIDAKCNEMHTPPAIWGGTEAKLAVTIAPYYMESTQVAGLTVYLDAVQIIKLVSGRGGDAKGMGFAEEDGFESSDDDSSSTFKDESSPKDDDSSEGGVDVEDF